tara:strand:- start:228 stop:707 length:480 start_codon:yes stop_codon:yes gene_type:complete
LKSDKSQLLIDPNCYTGTHKESLQSMHFTSKNNFQFSNYTEEGLLLPSSTNNNHCTVLHTTTDNNNNLQINYLSGLRGNDSSNRTNEYTTTNGNQDQLMYDEKSSLLQWSTPRTIAASRWMNVAANKLETRGKGGNDISDINNNYQYPTNQKMIDAGRR